ncbi:MAG: glycosyltransferase [Ignavibacteriales bacterium]|nr:glycosyltransferase [Ignavibacteriales bacterium]
MKPSIFNGFFGLINFEIFQILKKERGNFLVVHGWNNFTNMISIVLGKMYGLKVCIRGDNPYNQEILKNKIFLSFKRILLGKLLFSFIDYFLYVGKQNKEYYKYYGVPERKFVFTPHAVDNDRFKNEYEENKDKKRIIRKELGLPIDQKIILTSGKYIYKKRPMDLLKSYHLLSDENSALIFLGDGELRSEMEEYIKANVIKGVYLTGFKNQTEIGKYFACADIFVLPSGAGETCGVSS